MGYCPVCGARHQGSGLTVKNHLYLRCGGCGVLWLHPLPTADDLNRFYVNYRQIKAEEKSGYLTPSHLEQYQREKEMTFRDLGFEPSRLRGLRILDVGCANGPFLQMLKEWGGEGFGIDICTDLINEARQRGLQCRVARVEDLADEYDVICLWDILEHIPDPHGFMRQVCRLSRKGAHLFVQTPRCGRVAELFGGNWRYLLPIEHVILYSLEALALLLHEHGFTLRSWVTFGSGNNTGTVDPVVKRVFDTLAKEMGFGDTMAVWAVKRG